MFRLRFLKRLEKATLTRFKRALRERRYQTVSTLLRPTANYDAYRAAQNSGNARKLMRVSVREANIAYLTRYAVTSIGRHDLRVLCHGSRNGAEIRWFQAYLPEAHVLGTDIGDSATLFPNTIQWDFHDMKAEWRGAWDVVYSNSWDHAFDPPKAFGAWLASLAPGGKLLLEHSRYHTPAYVTDLDVFGATFDGLIQLLNTVDSSRFAVSEIINDLPIRTDNTRVVVVSHV